jgi:hypothetical protein
MAGSDEEGFRLARVSDAPAKARACHSGHSSPRHLSGHTQATICYVRHCVTVNKITARVHRREVCQCLSQGYYAVDKLAPDFGLRSGAERVAPLRSSGGCQKVNLHGHCQPIIVNVSGKAFDEICYERCLALIGQSRERPGWRCGSDQPRARLAADGYRAVRCSNLTWTFLRPAPSAIARSASIGASANGPPRGARSSIPRNVSMLSSRATWTSWRSLGHSAISSARSNLVERPKRRRHWRSAPGSHP